LGMACRRKTTRIDRRSRRSGMQTWH
jgi:hypothetical protein